jgi:hypothetical protein
MSEVQRDYWGVVISGKHADLKDWRSLFEPPFSMRALRPRQCVRGDQAL